MSQLNMDRLCIDVYIYGGYTNIVALAAFNEGSSTFSKRQRAFICDDFNTLNETQSVPSFHESLLHFNDTCYILRKSRRSIWCGASK